MDRLKVAFIGTGGRSNSYASAYAADERMEIVALADPAAEHRAATAARSNIPAGFREYDDWRGMLDAERELDGVVISTPNHLHADPAVACLERGLPIACEKPLATTQRDCERILEAEERFRGRSLIGFVLRSTPFYREIHRLIESGRIGTLLSIQADELVGLGVSSIMNRSPWRRYRDKSGGAMLEKSCHDHDILNWMTGAKPAALHSFGGRRLFTVNPALPETCDGCPAADSCRYYKEPAFSAHEDEQEKVMHRYIREDNRCIYNVDKDIMDIQSVQIEYRNGVIVNFMLQFDCSGPRAGRNFLATGTRGNICGNLHDSSIRLYDYASAEEELVSLKLDGSDHGGGGRLHALELKTMMEQPDYRPGQDAYAGYLAAVMCFAADKSAEEGRRVRFEYPEPRRVALV